MPDRMLDPTSQKRPSGRPSGSAGWLLLAALLLLAPTAIAQPPADGPAPEDVPAVTVRGDGMVRAKPDLASVELGVTAQAETAGAAQQEASRVAGAILEAVRALGVEEGAVQTSRLNLFPVYAERDPRRIPNGAPQEPEIVGYRASNVVSVRLRDLTKIGPVIDAAVGAGANEVQGVSFQLENDTEARQEALRKAVAAARAKAEAIAAALGQRLGPVLGVQEGGVSMEMPRFRMAADAMRMESMAATPVEAGEVGVSANVQVAWRLAPAP